MDEGTQERVLIIDDDEGVVKTVSNLLKKMKIDPGHAYNLADGLTKATEKKYDLVFLDVNLPDGNGIDIIPAILDNEFPPLIIIMTAYSDPDGAEMAIESGAWDYIKKPIALKDLKLQILRALEFQNQKKQTADFLTFDAPGIIGRSAPIRKSLTQASQIVYSDANVLITGETGTGKELFAKAIHDNSARRNGEFVVVDCSVLSENLIESALFGHEKGAFTGADRNRKGLITLANGGTLFLDEVGELPESIQSSFLRVLQEKSYRPVGSEKEVFSDFRVICATNKDLDRMVAEKRFRSDLLFRLKTFVLNLPPLKDRKDDISLIANNQIQKSCKSHNIFKKEASPEFIRMLEQYHWPGNVRELINAIETSVTAAQFEATLVPFHLPSKIRAQVTRSNVTKVDDTASDRTVIEIEPASLTHDDFINQAEKQYLESLFLDAKGDIETLLERTCLSRTVLYRKLKKHNIR